MIQLTILTHTRSLAAWAMLLVAACQDAHPPPDKPVGIPVELSLDGAVRTVLVAGAIPLAGLIDAAPSTWLEVRATSPDHRWLELETPTKTYPGAELRLYLDQGRAALGVFPPSSPNRSPQLAALANQPTAWLAPVSTISIVTRRDTTVASALIIELDGHEVPLSKDELAQLPLTSEANGWSLALVISLVTHERSLHTLRLVGAGELTLDPVVLRAPKSTYFLKANQRGEFVFRAWASGGDEPSQELRRVTKIVVE